MQRLSTKIAVTVYRQAARLSAAILVSSPVVQSVALRRSAATGEVSFGRSDIDMLVVVDEAKAGDGRLIASLYQLVRRARLLNPAMSHVELYDAAGVASHARIDTFWGSLERRSQLLLRGRPVPIPVAPVRPEHALNRFLLWVEWFFAIAVQQKNCRNLWKTALESWSAYAAAEGLTEEPATLRAEMEAQAGKCETNLQAARLADASYAARFVFALADRLHRSRLSRLHKLQGPVVFDAITAPMCVRRRFVVLPSSDFPLPGEVFAPGSFPCTPEILDLIIQAKNPFFFWVLPPELLNLGIQQPPAAAFLRACRYYGHDRFLLHPGFADRRPQVQSARLRLIRHAADWASQGQMPPAVAPAEIEHSMGGVQSPTHYYLNEYGPLYRESRKLHERLGSRPGVPGQLEES
jgi:hypothetical protein